MSELETNLQDILQEKQTKIIPENIKENVKIFDVVGTMADTSDATATADDIVNPKTAYVNGEKITGGIMTTEKDVSVNFSVDTINIASIQTNTLYALSHDKEYLFMLPVTGSIYQLNVYKLNSQNGSYSLHKSFSNNDLATDIGPYLFSVGNWGLFGDADKLLICVKHANYESDIYGIVYDRSNDTISMPHSAALGHFNAYGWSNSHPTLSDLTANSTHIMRYTQTGAITIKEYTSSYDKPLYNQGMTQWSCNGKVFSIFKTDGTSGSRYFVIDNYNCVIDKEVTDYICANTTGDYAFVNGVLKSISLSDTTNDYVIEDLDYTIEADSNIIIWIDARIYMVFPNISSITDGNYYDIDVYVFDEANKTTNKVYSTKGIQSHDSSCRNVSGGQFGTGFITSDTSESFKILYNSGEKLIDTLTYKSRTYYSNDSANAISTDIAQGKIAYGKNGEIIGSLPEVSENETFSEGINSETDTLVDMNTEAEGNLEQFYIEHAMNQDGVYREGSKEWCIVRYEDIVDLIGLTSDKIAYGETVLGITGTYTGEASL